MKSHGAKLRRQLYAHFRTMGGESPATRAPPNVGYLHGKAQHYIMFTDVIRSSWFRVFHDILSAYYQPTTALTVLHPKPCLALLSCASEDVFKWTYERLALVLRTAPQNVPPEWLISSYFFLFTQTHSPRCAMDNMVHYTF